MDRVGLTFFGFKHFPANRHGAGTLLYNNLEGGSANEQRPRRNHAPAFKTKVSVEALMKGFFIGMTENQAKIAFEN